ncbi:MAG TPA: efflux RND transporter periplasmic adaptor subunit, partial [Planctomycetota bacterium]|nr:efflux RND transporter periplasmic adaptor subunit [Planctomycetota bacterium]
AKEFRSLRVDQKVALTLDSDGTKLEGRVRLVSPVIDPATGTIKVTIEVPEYPAGTRPGDFAQVHIVTETRPEATLVPKLAVMNEKGETFVWVVKGDSAERRVVDVGFTNEAYAEIRQGVAPGEDVVTQGQRALQPGVRVKVVSTDVVFAEHAQP